MPIRPMGTPAPENPETPTRGNVATACLCMGDTSPHCEERTGSLPGKKSPHGQCGDTQAGGHESAGEFWINAHVWGKNSQDTSHCQGAPAFTVSL